MTLNHAHFEMLCALAASGQLTETELAQLQAHSANCPACSDRLSELSQLGAQLFCTHALALPRQKLPKEMLERFIDRANRDGVPLRARASAVGLSGAGAGMALLFAVLTVAVTLHFITNAKPADETRFVARLAESQNDQREELRNPTAGEVRADTSIKQDRSANKRQHLVQASAHANANAKRPQQAPASADFNQFDLAAYTRSLAKLPRPFLLAGKLAPILQWSPTSHTAPQLDLDVTLEFSRNDPPRLLAEYELKAFAPWIRQDHLLPAPGEAALLQTHFDPNAYIEAVNADLKGNLPVFQFARTQ